VRAFEKVQKAVMEAAESAAVPAGA
jgi:hypothetical protein